MAIVRFENAAICKWLRLTNTYFAEVEAYFVVCCDNKRFIMSLMTLTVNVCWTSLGRLLIGVNHSNKCIGTDCISTPICIQGLTRDFPSSHPSVWVLSNFYNRCMLILMQ